MIVVDAECNYRLSYQCLKQVQSSPQMMPKIFDEVWELTRNEDCQAFLPFLPFNGEDEVYLEYLNPIFQI